MNNDSDSAPMAETQTAPDAPKPNSDGHSGTSAASGRNWLPLIVATLTVLIVGGLFLLTLGRGKPKTPMAPITSTPDAYAQSLPITNLAMSEAGNLAGGKVTYIDGHIANQGTRTVTDITVQVLFRNPVHEVVQNESQPLKLIRMRQPYIDVGPLSVAPIKPHDQRDFRLIFDTVSADWDGAYPELRIVHVDAK